MLIIVLRGLMRWWWRGSSDWAELRQSMIGVKWLQEEIVSATGDDGGVDCRLLLVGIMALIIEPL